MWRRVNERFHHHVTPTRWKGCKEFMFWGSFSYYEKGLCYIWKAETAKEKREAKADLVTRNALTEATHRQAWELNTAMSWLGLKNKPRKKP